MNLQPARDVLKDFLCVELPDSIIEKVLNDEPSLREECEEDSISDTFPRNLFIDLIMKEIGVCPRPCYMEGLEAYKEFLQELIKKVPESGGEFIEEDV